jgi:hypothetical protein
MIHLMTTNTDVFSLYPYEFNLLDGYLNNRINETPTDAPPTIDQFRYPFKGDLPSVVDKTLIREYTTMTENLFHGMLT